MFLTEEERSLYKSHISRHYSRFEVTAAAHEAGHAIIWSILISNYPSLSKEYRSKIHAWIRIEQYNFSGRCIGIRLPGCDDKWSILGSLAGGYFCGLFMNDLYSNTYYTTDTLEWTVRLNGGREDWDMLKQDYRLPGYKRFYYRLLLDTLWAREWVRDLHLKYTYTLLQTHHLVPKKILPDILKYRVSKEITWKEIVKRKS